MAIKQNFQKTLVQRPLRKHKSTTNIRRGGGKKSRGCSAVLVPNRIQYCTVHSARKRNNPPILRSLLELGHILEDVNWAHLFQIKFGDNVPEPFYRRTITINEDAALFFSAQSFLDEVGVEEMHLDGTFKCVPAAPPSHQLFTIHIIKYNKSIALAYVLMSCWRQTF